ncbi:MAG: hypothetical protein KDA50_06620 [Rhodobacteraceae bacterium]|nr:hypothetical protein [Paracoccaceae bacterium]
MVIKNTTLEFRTTNQSLWSPGQARSFRISTGDLLIYEAPELSHPFDFDIKVAGASGEAYMNFLVGLEAYAELVDAGHFNAAYDIDVAVSYTPGIDVSLALANTGNTDVSFDLTRWNVRSARVDSVGFSGSPGAGLDFVLNLELGFRNIHWFAFFASGDEPDFKLIDIQERVPIIEIKPEFEISGQLYPGIELFARLPTGADTEGASVGSVVVAASGFSDTKFIELNVDIDELFVELASKIPQVGAIIEKIGEIVFFDESFDLADYIPYVPRGKFELSATVLDIDANAGTVLTEDVSLDIGGGDTTPDVRVVLRSDAGTPSDFSDDVVVQTTLGQVANVRMPLPNALGPDGTSVVTVTGYYDLTDIQYAHSVGLGIDAALTIRALQAEFGGAWVSDDLSFSFGPLLDLTFPDGGFQAKLFDFFNDDFALPTGTYAATPTSGTDPTSWGYAQGAFNREIDTYEVFVTDVSPSGWDPEAPNAAQRVYEYKAALAQNQATTVATFGHLWNNDPAQDVKTALAGRNNPAPAGSSDVSRLWFGHLSSDITLNANANNYTVVNVDPSVAPDDVLGANVSVNDGTPGFTDALLDLDPNSTADGPYVYANSPIEYKVAVLNGIANSTYVSYQYTPGTQNNILKSQRSAQVQGSAHGDVMVLRDAEGKYFDGGGEDRGVFGTLVAPDYFIADFKHIFPNRAISFDSSEANFAGGVVVAGSVTLRNIEAFVLRTGDLDDFLSGGQHEDWFETSGGNDFIQLAPDLAKDFVSAGADDDVIYYRFDIDGGGTINSLPDAIYGGTGFDIGVFAATDVIVGGGSPSADAAEINISVVVDGSPAAHATARSSVDALFHMLDVHDGGSFGDASAFGQPGNETSRDTFAQAEADQDFLRYGKLGHNVGADFYSDVEAIDVIGSDFTDDVVIYTGGLQYFGGDGEYSATVQHVDTLIADFGAYALRKGVTTGVNLVAGNRLGQTAPDQILTFGDTVFDGFERIVAFGTDQGDFFLGGRYADGFRAGDGNDILDGGEFDPFADMVFDPRGFVTPGIITVDRDLLFGEDGDDMFFWSDDGADILDGGAGDDWLIVTAEAGSLGLEYGLYTAASLALPDPVRTVFDASATADEIENAFDLLTDVTVTIQGQPVVQGRGMRFGDTLGDPADDPYLNYRDIEHVNVTGSDTASDLIFYEGGATYDAGGEGAGPGDVFAADFSAQHVGIDLSFGAANAAGVALANGVFVRGFERGIVHAGSGNDRLKGGDLEDRLRGGGGADILDGGDGNDRIYGEDGDDLLFWDGSGNDFASGGAGFDHLVLGARGQELRWTLADASFNTLGTGYIGATASRAALDAALDNLPLAELILAYTNNKSLLYQEIEAVNVAGSHDFDDLVIYQNGLISYGGDRVGDADVFAADLSAETVDLILLADSDQNAGAAAVNGANAFDADGNFTGFAGVRDIGNGTYMGGFERLHVRTGSGNDTVFGGALADSIHTGDGDDVVDAGTGGTVANPDLVNTGLGDDVLTYRGDVADFDGGSAGGDYDILNFEADTGALSFAILDGAGAQIGATYTGASSTRADLTAMFAANPTFAAGLRYTHATGSLTYRNIEELLIQGSDEGDFLVAPLRNGNLFGGDGDDVLVSSLGIDILVGGAGVDTYAFRSGDGADFIARETYQGGRIYFDNLASTDVTYARVGTDDLAITETGGALPTLTIYDYFAAGGRGLDFEFDFTDFTGRIDLSHLGGAVVTPAAAGATIEGTAGDDDFVNDGTGRDDDIFGRAGDDFFSGGFGGDLFNGGAGGDSVSYHASGVSGGVAIDLIYRAGLGGIAAGDILVSVENLFGTDHNDSLLGDRAANVLFGAQGADELAGREGADLLAGNEGDDHLYGDQGDDQLFGDEDDDILEGGDGDDFLEGGDGDDQLFGGADDDTLIGGAGTDTAFGQAGDDTYVHGGDDDAATAANENGVDSFDGGADDDLVDLSEFEYAVHIRQGFGAAQDGIRSDFASTVTGALNAEVLIVANVERFVGTDFDDRFDVSAPGQTFGGGAGDDFFVAGAGSQTLFGGTGYDTLDLDFGQPAPGPVEVDLIQGIVTDASGSADTVSGIERFLGTALGDVFIGDALDNDFEDKGGSDVVEGGAGNDLFIAGVDAIGTDDTYHGGAGFDTLDYSAATNALSIDLLFNVADDLFGVGIGFDTISGIEAVITGSGDDDIYGSDVHNVIDGGAGNDIIRGDLGDDVILGGLGDDSLFGDLETPDVADGFDTLDYSAITQSIALDLRLAGVRATGAGIGNDTIVGFEAFVSGLASDTMIGDGGDQTFFFGGDAGEGGFDLFDGQGGDDTADFSRFGAAVRVDLLDAIEVTTRDRPDLDPALGASRNLADLSGIENVVLTDFDDAMLGTGGADLLDGGRGDDFLTGRAGNDVLRGGDGRDAADYSQETGGAGVQIDLAGGIGLVSGETGPLAIDTHGDVDKLDSIESAIGTSQHDVIYGSSAGNVLVGGDGDDSIYGISGRNLLSGGRGNDTIVGGVDDDMISGGGDADFLFGGAGADSLSGGDGDDHLYIDGAWDSVDGGAGTDRVLFETSAGLSLDLSLWTGVEEVEGAAGDDTMDGSGVSTGLSLFGDDGDDILTGGSAKDRLEGGDDDDVLNGGANNDVLLGGSGNDILIGGDGRDTIHGQSGIDTVSFETASRRIWVDLEAGRAALGAGSDTLTGIENATGSDFDDLMFGSSGANTMRGGSGNDDIRGQDGDDILFGGSGNDFLMGGTGANTLHGQSGIDTVSYEGTNRRVIINLDRGTSYLGAGEDTLVSIENLIGTSFNDVLIGSSISNTLRGGDGDDDLRGGDGDDLLIGGAGSNRLQGQGGMDTVSYADAATRVVINLALGTNLLGARLDTLSEIESLIGSNFDDVLVGSNGSNTLRGGRGNDILRGGDGDDFLVGGDGQNQLHGQAGNDTVSYEDVVGRRVVINLELGTSYLAAGQDTLTNIENLIGTDLSDILVGSAVANTLRGGNGDDELHGGGGDDTLLGGLGADRIFGGRGNDDLRGGGTDQMADTFVFADGAGTDRIFDWEDGFDLLDVTGITGVSDFADVSVDQSSGTHTVITAGAETIILEGFLGIVDASDFA